MYACTLTYAQACMPVRILFFVPLFFLKKNNMNLVDRVTETTNMYVQISLTSSTAESHCALNLSAKCVKELCFKVLTC